nr:DUF2933 domain-containing protein [Marinobacterium zhoushanense]
MSGRGMVALGAVAILGYFLVMEHRAHLVAWLPYLMLLLCPLMHLFMHHGHGHGSSQGGDTKHRDDK